MRCATGHGMRWLLTSRSNTNISTFTTTIWPLALSQQSDVHLGRMDTAIYACP